MTRTLLATTLIAVSIAVLAANTIGGALAQNAARILFVALCLIGVRTSTLREFLLLSAALILGGLLYQSSDGRLALLAGMDLASYFAAFIALLTALKIGAERSASVLSVGQYLIRQPSGRRFIATASGGHVLGVFLNFGAVSLMAPLIQSATKRADGSIDRDLERRQMSALLRGFAWILLWAPTTLTQAVLLTLFTEIDQGKIVSFGVATSLLMMGLGLAYDRFEWRGQAKPFSDGAAPVFPRKAFFRLALVCGSLIGATGALQLRMGYNTALSLMFIAPSVTFFWFVMQKPAGVSLGRQLASFGPALQSDAPGLARAAIALGLSGFIGRALADVLPVATIATQTDLSQMPGWLFLAILPLLITLGGQVALSPIILVVFIGQVVQSFPTLPAEPTHIVFALSAGWAISMFASPNATATLLISATSRIPPTTLTWRWNLRYGAICYIVLLCIFALLES
ncbi:hypothetical protein [Shimia sp.]|uniref:hypothetical protein n=1 Tax=Shimia sp. TaxID=1954381 RepID=UPI00329A393E